MRADLESVQQQALARGMRIRIHSGYVVEEELFTLVDSADRPTVLCDVPLARIAAELTKPLDWLAPKPAWQTLLSRTPQPKPVHRRAGPLHELWAAMEVEALSRFDRQGGPPDNRAEFSRRLRAWCQHQHGRAPKDPKQVSKRIREWLEQWQKMRAAELTAPAPARACGKMGRPRPEPWGWHPHKPGAAQSDAAAR